jgi:hypothetical protein
MRSDGRRTAPEMTAKSDNNFEMSNGTARPAWAQVWHSGSSSFRGDRLPDGLLSVASGDGTTGDTGSTRGSLSTRTMDERRSIGRTKVGKDALLFFGAQTALARSRILQMRAPAFARKTWPPYRRISNCPSINFALAAIAV